MDAPGLLLRSRLQQEGRRPRRSRLLRALPDRRRAARTGGRAGGRPVFAGRRATGQEGGALGDRKWLPVTYKPRGENGIVPGSEDVTGSRLHIVNQTRITLCPVAGTGRGLGRTQLSRQLSSREQGWVPTSRVVGPVSATGAALRPGSRGPQEGEVPAVPLGCPPPRMSFLLPLPHLHDTFSGPHPHLRGPCLTGLPASVCVGPGVALGCLSHTTPAGPAQALGPGVNELLRAEPPAPWPAAWVTAPSGAEPACTRAADKAGSTAMLLLSCCGSMRLASRSEGLVS